MNKKSDLKSKINKLLYANRGVIKFIYTLIILNIIALVLESYQPIGDRFELGFRWFEIFSIVIFTIEYLGRLYVSNGNGKPRSKFVFSFYGLVDLLSIIPFYLPFLFVFDLRVIRVLRVFRLIRIFKLGRFNNSFKTIIQVLKETKEELVMTMFFAFVLLLISSTLMYYAETEVQPEKFQSIGHSFWWAIATLTTVGYGDVYPITGLGKVISSFIAIIGIGFIALPTGIISSTFIGKIKNKQNTVCRNCGTIVKD